MSGPTLYFIRHGEKDTIPTDADGNVIIDRDNQSNPTPVDGKIDLDGLNSDGEIRAQFLPQIFGKPEYNIQQIYTPQFDPAAATPQIKNHNLGAKTIDPWGNARPYQTVLPLVQYFKDQGPGRAVPHDHTIGVEDHDGLVDAINSWISGTWPSNQGNILVCWEHHNLRPILAKLFGVKKDTLPKYPDDRFDIIWICAASGSGSKPAYTQITDTDYEHVTSWNTMYTGALDGDLTYPATFEY